MLRLAVVIASVSLALAQQPSTENTPRLRRIGPTLSSTPGSLDGFRPTRVVLPTFPQGAPDGSTAFLRFTIVRGKAVGIQVRGDRSLADAALKAVKNWRFAMPLDGSSPITGEIEFRCEDGKAILGDVGYRLQSTSSER